ncbi:asparagine synthetase B family protein, partial [Roseateles sp. GG27B]
MDDLGRILSIEAAVAHSQYTFREQSTSPMSTIQKTLLVGAPRFTATTQAVQANDASTEDRWRQLLAFCPDPTAQLAKVEGPFALGLRNADGRTWLAVDRFGVQTLCYRIVNGELRFAARADELSDASSQIDPQAIFDYLYFHCIPSPRTIFKDVYRLPPGHYAKFENGQLAVAPYWQPEFSEPQGPVSFDALKGEFRELLCNAVARSLDGSTPACFLSGGTDSSTVAGMIREATGQAGHSYSIGFNAEGYDEMAYARLAAKHFKTEHHEYYVTPDDLVRSMAEVASSYDQPFGNSSALPAYYCAKVARENGVTRILAGDGGDELFGGN